MPMNSRWREGNTVRLLENAEQYYPRVFAAIERAQREVLLETFILFEDKVGCRLHELLVAAARRGVRVEVTVDGYGSPEMSRAFVTALADAGVRLHVYGPARRVLGMRLNVFRRLHRKLVCVDRRIAFVAGMNFAADHLASLGEVSKQDYAVELEGPVVGDVHAFLESALAPGPGWRVREHRPEDFPDAVEPETVRTAGEAARADPERDPALVCAADGPVIAESAAARVAFVVRDNARHRTDIERGYRAAMRTARRSLLIANAYFFPGYRFLRDLRAAAARGADVRLVLQGRPDEPLALHAARLLYRHLADAGVRIHEYRRRPLHGKVAAADDEWLTVGSSNLDPLSLALNLEANVFIRDRVLATALREHLHALIDAHCEEVDTSRLPRPTALRALRSTVLFHVLRRFPAWAGLLPGNRPLIANVQRRRGAGEVDAARETRGTQPQP